MHRIACHQRHSACAHIPSFPRFPPWRNYFVENAVRRRGDAARTPMTLLIWSKLLTKLSKFALCPHEPRRLFPEDCFSALITITVSKEPRCCGDRATRRHVALVCRSFIVFRLIPIPYLNVSDFNLVISSILFHLPAAFQMCFTRLANSVHKRDCEQAFSATRFHPSRRGAALACSPTRQTFSNDRCCVMLFDRWEQGIGALDSTFPDGDLIRGSVRTSPKDSRGYE